MFFFQSPLAEAALPLDDYSFIDHLWADWSPGYDGAGTWPGSRSPSATPSTSLAAISYYRALYDPALQVPELAEEQAATLLPDAEADPVPARARRRLHAARRPSAIAARLLAEGSDVEVVDDAGHFLHLERPDVVNRASSGSSPPDGGRPRRARQLGQPEDGVRPPDQRGEALGHQSGRHPLGPAGSSGQPQARGERRPAARRPRAARRAAVPGPGGPTRRRCSAGAPSGWRRHGSGRRRRWRRQAHWRRSGQRAQPGRAAVHTVAPRSNMAWLNSHDSARRHQPVAQRRGLGGRVSGRPATHAGQHPHARWCRRPPRRRSKAKARTARAV